MTRSWAWPTAIVEAGHAWLQLCEQGLGEFGEEGSVARIIGVVLVMAVVGALFRRRRPLSGIEEGRDAGLAAPIVPPLHGHERTRISSSAHRTGVRRR